jgi:DNA-binding beta-propeller fold protein YncE
MIVALLLVVGGALYFIAPLGNQRSASSATTTSSAATNPLTLTQTYALPSVQGRIDHMDVDPSTNRLFVAEYGNNSVATVDLKTGSLLHVIEGLSSPQNVAFIPDTNAIYVSNAGDGTVRVYNGSSYAPAKTLTFASDADNMRYDTARKLLYVGYGVGSTGTAGIGVIDITKTQIVGDIHLEGHPESFVLEQKGSFIFANVPPIGSVVEIDRNTNTVSATWSLDPIGGNFPMTLDEGHGLLFVGTRSPSKLVTIDVSSGHELSTVDACSDADDLFYDPSAASVYMSCGQGSIQVYRENGTSLSLAYAVPTRSGARTSLFVPAQGELFLAMPSSGSLQAGVAVYALATSSATTTSNRQ